MPQSNSTPESSLETKIGQERLRQAYYSFNTALATSVLCAGISFLGAAMLLFGKVAEGTVVASSGALSSAGCARLAKDANDRLDKIMNELQDEA